VFIVMCTYSNDVLGRMVYLYTTTYCNAIVQEERLGMNFYSAPHENRAE
jgi:hypothetical protein